MPLFKCQIIDENGKHLTKLIECSDEYNLKASLSLNHQLLVKAKLIQEKKVNTFFAVSGRVKSGEVIIFLREFSVMINAGATITEALQIIRKQKHTKAFENVLQNVFNDVQSGLLLSEAFGKYPKVFPNFFKSMVSIGEVSGSLGMVLDNLADYYENDRKIKKKAKSATVYPKILLAFIIIVVAFVFLFIVPQFEKTILELGGNVPLITQIVLNISRFFRDYLFVIIPIIALVIFLIVLFLRSKKGRLINDTIKFYVPLIGKVNKSVITSRFSKAFIILLDSGMTITDCMENLVIMLDSELFKKRFLFAIEEVKRGKKVAQAIGETNIFPDVLVDMLAIGERSSNISKVLKSTSSYFDENVDSAVSSLTASLEPIMIVLLGLVVGIVILAVFLPIIELMQNI